MDTIEKWNSLTDLQKRAFGDRFITHESNLHAWSKPFDKLSPHKQKVVLNSLDNVDAESLNFVLS